MSDYSPPNPLPEDLYLVRNCLLQRIIFKYENVCLKQINADFILNMSKSLVAMAKNMIYFKLDGCKYSFSSMAAF